MDIKNINQSLVNNRLNDSLKNQEKAQGAGVASANSEQAKTADKVTLTSVSAQAKDLEVKAEATNIDNSEKIAALKAAIQDGSYQVNSENVANKLIQTEALFARA